MSSLEFASIPLQDVTVGYDAVITPSFRVLSEETLEKLVANFGETQSSGATAKYRYRAVVDDVQILVDSFEMSVYWQSKGGRPYPRFETLVSVLDRIQSIVRYEINRVHIAYENQLSPAVTPSTYLHVPGIDASLLDAVTHISVEKDSGSGTQVSFVLNKDSDRISFSTSASRDVATTEEASSVLRNETRSPLVSFFSTIVTDHAKKEWNLSPAHDTDA